MSKTETPIYKQGDDFSNLEMMKKEMFKRTFLCCSLTNEEILSDTAVHNIEVAVAAANAFSNLIRAEVVLRKG